MGQAVAQFATQTDPRTGQITAWSDTIASLYRLGIGVIIATFATLLIGIALGVVPLVRAALGPLVAIIAVIPPIAILPILFIAMGLGEASKIALIALGIAPFMIRDLAAHVAGLPVEQMIKAQTLGANSWQLTLRVALPQALPRLINSLRLSMGPAWVFLIYHRGDRLRCRAWLSHLPGPPLLGDGYHPAIRRVDLAAGHRHRCAAAADQPQGLSLGA